MQSTTKAREELEGTVWAWVDKIQDPDRDQISKEDLFHAYKLFFPTHQSPKWKCKKNCRQNPNCYCGKLKKNPSNCESEIITKNACCHLTREISLPEKKSRQNERSPVLCSLNVNKVSRFFFMKLSF